MKIYLQPTRCDEKLAVSVSGDVIFINDCKLDLSNLREGEKISSRAIGNMFVVGDVFRVGGDIHISILLPHGIDAPIETRFPSETPISVISGMVNLPPFCNNGDINE